MGSGRKPDGVEPENSPPPEPWVNEEGVDLTQIQALLALTPTERVHLLVTAANNLLRLKDNVRRV